MQIGLCRLKCWTSVAFTGSVAQRSAGSEVTITIDPGHMMRVRVSRAFATSNYHGDTALPVIQVLIDKV